MGTILEWIQVMIAESVINCFVLLLGFFGFVILEIT